MSTVLVDSVQARKLPSQRLENSNSGQKCVVPDCEHPEDPRRSDADVGKLKSLKFSPPGIARLLERWRGNLGTLTPTPQTATIPKGMNPSDREGTFHAVCDGTGAREASGCGKIDPNNFSSGGTPAYTESLHGSGVSWILQGSKLECGRGRGYARGCMARPP